MRDAKRRAPARPLSPPKRQRHGAEGILDQIALVAEQWKTDDTAPATREASHEVTLANRIYHTYISADDSAEALAALDHYRFIQQFLWPHLCRLTTAQNNEVNPSNQRISHAHALSVVALFNHRRSHHPSLAVDLLELFDSNVKGFVLIVEALFRLPLQSFSATERCSRIFFLLHIFRSLDHECARQALLPLVSLPVWVNLSQRGRRLQVERFPHVSKPLSKLLRRAKKREQNHMAPLSETAVMTVLTEIELECVRLISDPVESALSVLSAAMSLFTELVSQLRFRRTTLPLLSDRGTLPLVQGLTLELRRDPRAFGLRTWREWLQVLDKFIFYATFPLDPVTGELLSRNSVRTESSSRLLALQRVARAVQGRERSPIGGPLKHLPLATHSVVGTAEFLRTALYDCSDAVLNNFEEAVGTSHMVRILSSIVEELRLYPSTPVDSTIRKIRVSALASHCSVQKDALDTFKAAPLMINERDLWGLMGANARRSDAALPVLNLEFLDIQDYLLRNFALFKWEAAWAAREDIEDAILRTQPSFDGTAVRFSGSAKMSAPILSVRVVKVGPDLPDAPRPAYVNVDIEIDAGRLSRNVRSEWGELREHDVLYLVKISTSLTQHIGHATSLADDRDELFLNCVVRSFVVGGSESQLRHNGIGRKGGRPERSITISGTVDSTQYYYDSTSSGASLNVFNGFHLLVRRRSEVNNFLPILSSLRELILFRRPVLPDWIQEVIIGRNTSQESEVSVAKRAKEAIDYVDTFTSKENLKESFPGLTITFNPTTHGGVSHRQRRPFHKILFTTNKSDDKICGAEVDTYVAPRRKCLDESDADLFNSTTFNTMQIKAITQAMQPGITLIAGPPGTGKTTCIVQIISNLYHAVPAERILLVSRTNHALNDIVERLLLRDMDPLRILRLGKGESDVVSEESLSKTGRVNALLQKRLDLLSDVAALSRSLGHDSDAQTWSCESALHFRDEVVLTLWEKFLAGDKCSWEYFPFKEFIGLKSHRVSQSSAGAEGSTNKDQDEEVRDAYNVVLSLFEDLQAVHFLEILRTTRQRADYVVAAHSRILAMTAVHGAMNRNDFVAQSLSYDTLVMEESAECLDIEAFLVLLLQKRTSLKRIVLVGDHKQLPPVVQDTSLRQKSNFSQSLFTRLVRLGNSVVQLSEQGRSRPSIANLFRWRYPQLGDMQSVLNEPKFKKANPGFARPYQFIDTGEVSSESQPLPHFYQNVTEAEYIAFTFLYMRLLGYPADKIAILTTYNGQVKLLREVIEARSAQFGNFGALPMISTVDRFQGRQAEYVLLSLVRTRSLGHLKDIRRVTVALSRARCGLYIFGYWELFASSLDFNPIARQLCEHLKLELVAEETFGECERNESDEVDASLCREVHSPADMAAIASHVRGKMQ